MLDLRSIREDPEPARAALRRRDAGDELDELLRLDEQRREILPELEEGRGRRNRVSEEIAQLKREGGSADERIGGMRGLGGRLKEQEAELPRVEAARDELAARLPNLPDPDAPDGETEDDAVPLREVGERPEFDFEIRDHLDLGIANGWIEMEKASATSGSRFAYLMGDLVFVEMALVRLTLDMLRDEGLTPVIPPVLVREGPLFGTGFFPGEREMIYEVPRDELFLVGTSEVSLAALHAGEILGADELPRRYAGHSTCFRREAGAAGRDTQGIFRVHQFDKVEMFSFVEPDKSQDEHERLLGIEEEILRALEIPYRVVNIASNDLGNSAAKKYDLEAWLPGQERYRELTSCSNTTAYQARRLEIRYRKKEGAPVQPVHTLNGTAVAVGRTIIAIAENHQREDGTVEIRAVLHPFGAPQTI